LFAALKHADGTIVLLGIQINFAEQRNIIRPLRVGRSDLRQNAFGLGAVAHVAVCLRQSGESVERRRIQPKAFVVGIKRNLRFSCETGCVSK
jgi:hypothetical protein